MPFEIDIIRVNRREVAYEYCTVSPSYLALAHLSTVLRWLVFRSQRLQTQRFFWKICMWQDSRHSRGSEKFYHNALWRARQEGRQYRAEYRRERSGLQARICVHHFHVFQIYKIWRMAHYILYTGVILNGFCFSWRIKDQLDVTFYFISLLMYSTCFGH